MFDFINKGVEKNSEFGGMVKEEEETLNENILKQFEIHNDGDWGSKDVYILTNKRDPEEKNLQEEFLDKRDWTLPKINDYIMNFHFMPPEIYVREVLLSQQNTLILTSITYFK